MCEITWKNPLQSKWYKMEFRCRNNHSTRPREKTRDKSLDEKLRTSHAKQGVRNQASTLDSLLNLLLLLEAKAYLGAVWIAAIMLLPSRRARGMNYYTLELAWGQWTGPRKSSAQNKSPRETRGAVLLCAQTCICARRSKKLHCKLPGDKTALSHTRWRFFVSNLKKKKRLFSTAYNF